MKSLRIPLAMLMFALAPLAWAQPSAPLTANVEQQMSADEFKAAGLDKLSAQELAALNAWLQHKVVQETTKAVEVAKEEGRKEVKEINRGFFDFGSSEAIESALVGEFNGFAKGRKYTLENGQVWEQIEPASLDGVRRTNPKVSIKPGMFNNWFMRIDGYNTAAKVRRIK
ncbi:hypothetical protein CSC74_14100 [Pseudoxanthomonas yeongjuensis]|uniref:hypothetical protein n=1 Tax=Pseudoxanthomonas yeongjuensis TaxID=377616 RepID=UPI001390AD36|nr:hypothetical protein CSC74_14100 [Pseudoxanthomonas yeongjuensis]